MPRPEVLESSSVSRARMPQGTVAERQFIRFTRLQRILHICMIVSFITLALTGLTLKFSYTKWASGAFSSAGGIRERGQHSPECRDRDVRSFHYASGGLVPLEEKSARFVARAAAGTEQYGPHPKGLH